MCMPPGHQMEGIVRRNRRTTTAKEEKMARQEHIQFYGLLTSAYSRFIIFRSALNLRAPAELISCAVRGNDNIGYVFISFCENDDLRLWPLDLLLNYVSSTGYIIIY